MPRLTLYPNGIVAAKTGGRGNSNPPPRSAVSGWTGGAARRNDLFLRSVDFAAVDRRGLNGIAATLTMRCAPPTEEEYRRLRKQFLQDLRRFGAVLIHHVTEMQPRLGHPDGPVPHMHMAVFFPPSLRYFRERNISLEQERAHLHLVVPYYWELHFQPFGPLRIAQHVKRIHDLAGWAGYVAKHGARGAAHYQRLRELMPQGWQTTGRLWGKSGDWPVSKTARTISDDVFYALRRFVRRLLLAKAARDLVQLSIRRADAANQGQRTQADRLHRRTMSRIDYLKSRLRRSDEKSGRILPVSDWIADDHIRIWLARCCVQYDWTDPKSGEVISLWTLPSKQPGEHLWAIDDRLSASRSQP